MGTQARSGEPDFVLVLRAQGLSGAPGADSCLRAVPISGGAQGLYVSMGRREEDTCLVLSLWLHFKLIYLFIFGCTSSLSLPRLSLVSAEATL